MEFMTELSVDTLVALPPAGGSASVVRPWRPHLDRATRIMVPNVRRILCDLESSGPVPPPEEGGRLRQVAQVVSEQLPQTPYVLAGHSLGGLLAVEAAAARQVAGDRMPCAVVVMGSRPPMQGTAQLFQPLLSLDDAAFLNVMVAMGAAAQDLVDSHAGALFIPTLRRDIRLVCGYSPRPTDVTRLTVPLHAWHADQDLVAPLEYAPHWAMHAGAGFHTRVFQGFHNFPQEQGELVGAGLQKLLSLHRLSGK